MKEKRYITKWRKKIEMEIKGAIEYQWALMPNLQITQRIQAPVQLWEDTKSFSQGKISTRMLKWIHTNSITINSSLCNLFQWKTRTVLNSNNMSLISHLTQSKILEIKYTRVELVVDWTQRITMQLVLQHLALDNKLDHRLATTKLLAKVHLSKCQETIVIFLFNRHLPPCKRAIQIKCKKRRH